MPVRIQPVLMPGCCDNRVNFYDAAPTGPGIDATVNCKNGRAADISDLVGVIKAHRITVIDPLKRHPGRIGPQYLLTKVEHVHI